MKISPVALFAAGDVDKAVRDAVIMCRWTHNNNIALSGATAVAAATAEAMKREATLQSVIDAGIYGAKKVLRSAARPARCWPGLRWRSGFRWRWKSDAGREIYSPPWMRFRPHRLRAGRCGGGACQLRAFSRSKGRHHGSHLRRG